MVPYAVYEGAQAKDERMAKRLIVAIIVLAVAFLLSNIAWLYVWNQFDYSSVEMDGATFGELSDTFFLSERQIKNIVYKGEQIIFKHI